MNIFYALAGKKRKENKVNFLKLFIIAILVFSVSGCADIAPPTPQEIISKPLGSGSIRRGMSKEEVKDLWGEPSQINYGVKNKNLWEGEREEWVYVARYSNIPLDAGYLSKTKKLYFDGDSLTNIVEE